MIKGIQTAVTVLSGLLTNPEFRERFSRMVGVVFSRGSGTDISILNLLAELIPDELMPPTIPIIFDPVPGGSAIDPKAAERQRELDGQTPLEYRRLPSHIRQAYVILAKDEKRDAFAPLKPSHLSSTNKGKKITLETAQDTRLVTLVHPGTHADIVSTSKEDIEKKQQSQPNTPASQINASLLISILATCGAHPTWKKGSLFDHLSQKPLSTAQMLACCRTEVNKQWSIDKRLMYTPKKRNINRGHDDMVPLLSMGFPAFIVHHLLLLPNAFLQDRFSKQYGRDVSIIDSKFCKKMLYALWDRDIAPRLKAFAIPERQLKARKREWELAIKTWKSDVNSFSKDKKALKAPLVIKEEQYFNVSSDLTESYVDLGEDVEVYQEELGELGKKIEKLLNGEHTKLSYDELQFQYENIRECLHDLGHHFEGQFQRFERLGKTFDKVCAQLQ